jgi:hypothetical protein
MKTEIAYYRIEKLIDGVICVTYLKTHIASPKPFNSSDISKEEYELNVGL